MLDKSKKVCYNSEAELRDEKKVKKTKKVFKNLLTNRFGCDIITKSSAKAFDNGSIAQLGEHLPYKLRVIGSSPIVSTIWSGSSVG